MGPSGSLCRRNGNPVYQHVDHERLPVGKAGMGYLVDFGRATDTSIPPRSDFSFIFNAPRLFTRTREESRAGRRLRNPCHGGRPIQLSIDSLVRTQHPQPVILGGGLDWDMWKVMMV